MEELYLGVPEVFYGLETGQIDPGNTARFFFTCGRNDLFRDDGFVPTFLLENERIDSECYNPFDVSPAGFTSAERWSQWDKFVEMVRKADGENRVKWDETRDFADIAEEMTRRGHPVWLNGRLYDAGDKKTVSKRFQPIILTFNPSWS